jgi:hypothetical protein
MSTGGVIALVVVVVAVLVIAAIVLGVRSRQRRRLAETFGREYDVAVEDEGSRRRAERELRARQERHDQLDIRDLSPESRTRYLQTWQGVQARFVDMPENAVAEADELIGAVMVERGYPPMSSFDQRAAELSVEHAQVLTSYRSAHAIAERPAAERTTEDLRHAMVDYRRLFEELVEADRVRSQEPSSDGAVPANPDA